MTKDRKVYLDLELKTELGAEGKGEVLQINLAFLSMQGSDSWWQVLLQGILLTGRQGLLSEIFFSAPISHITAFSYMTS